jgi:hypothetical protein
MALAGAVLPISGVIQPEPRASSRYPSLVAEAQCEPEIEPDRVPGQDPGRAVGALRGGSSDALFPTEVHFLLNFLIGAFGDANHRSTPLKTAQGQQRPCPSAAKCIYAKASAVLSRHGP